ncbi:hypothetical protein ABMA28_015062 [Loxostege sticticalis]|uniref:Reverse transcriptase domain-containing protein n=1 Tax=Loxostege sticticalis TaxID=481309 RepID=A0ABD0TE66_LOXSC
MSQPSPPASGDVDAETRCPLCPLPRFFKGNRGLKIHLGRAHKSAASDLATTSHHPSNQPFWQTLGNLKKSLPVVKRIPRSARHQVALSLTQCIERVVSENSFDRWSELLSFSYKILNVTQDISNNSSLTQKIKENCRSFRTIQDLTIPSSRPRNSNHSIKLIESKISDADKHPAPAATLLLPNPPIPDSAHLLTKEDEVMASIFSFKSGSASGLDGLSPQHLKDLLSVSVGDTGRVLLHNLTLLINLMLSGKVNSQICDILYGANLIALKKKDGGIRPIAVGSTFRRIASKICCKHIAASVAADFQPVQLGFGIKGGCEAAVHAVRTFLSLNAGEVVLKVDVKNAFNSVDRGTLLTQALDKSPLIYNYLWQCYSEPSKLLYQNNLIYSSVGCQQGDPLGPAIFSLAIHPIISSLNSKLNVWYLDDGTIAGDASTVL